MEHRNGVSKALFKSRTINGIAESISYSFQQLNRIPVNQEQDIRTVNDLRKWLRNLESEIDRITTE